MSFAFADCSSLVQIEISSSIGTLPEAGFLGCSSLADVRLREGLQRIGDFSFAGATSLVKVELPASTTVIGLYAFAGCVSLKEMHISEGLIEVGTRSFAACVSLSGIRVPSTVNKIGLFAFSECINLVSVEFAPAIQGPLSIEASAFHNCKSLMNIELLQKINIHENALDGCDSLQCVFGDHRLAVLSMRFQSEPLHQCCYHSFDTTVDEVRLHLYYDPEKWIDDDNVLDLAFGMTPFHVLLSAASRRLDLLELLLQTYPPFVLDCKDRFGRRAIEYLTFIWNEETRALMEAYLQKWLIDQLEGCLVNDWLSDMTQRVTCILEEEDQENRDCLIRDACCTMKRYERVETLSLLELALWKKDMVSGDDVNGAPLPSSDREAHRAKCGATFLVPNVIAFMESVEW